jgi:hypothetical protein
MADYTSETLTLKIRRWKIPAAEPWGANAAEVSKAGAGAELAYREYHKIPKDQGIPDNALRFLPGDDEIIIEFRYETKDQT